MLGFWSLRWHSIVKRSWKVIFGSTDDSWEPWSEGIIDGTDVTVVVATLSGWIAWPVVTRGRRRMRAVTGSSAVDCFCRTRCGVASMLFAALSALIFSASSETLGPSSLSGLMSRGGKPGLELVTQAGQFGQIGVVQERLAQAGLVVAQLGLGDGEVLPDTDAFGAVATGQAFQGVQDGTRPVMVARQRVDGA